MPRAIGHQVRLDTAIPPSLYAALSDESKRSGQKLADIVRRALKNELATCSVGSQITPKTKGIIRRAVSAGPVYAVAGAYEEYAEFRDPVTGKTVRLETVEFQVGNEYCVVEDVFTSRQRNAMYVAIEDALSKEGA